jgi:hypothetical protein
MTIRIGKVYCEPHRGMRIDEAFFFSAFAAKAEEIAP